MYETLDQAFDEALSEDQAAEFGKQLTSLKDIVTSESVSFLEEMIDEFTTFAMTVGFDGLLADIMKERLEKLEGLQPEESLSTEALDSDDGRNEDLIPLDDLEQMVLSWQHVKE